MAWANIKLFNVPYLHVQSFLCRRTDATQKPTTRRRRANIFSHLIPISLRTCQLFPISSALPCLLYSSDQLSFEKFNLLARILRNTMQENGCYPEKGENQKKDPPIFLTAFSLTWEYPDFPSLQVLCYAWSSSIQFVMWRGSTYLQESCATLCRRMDATQKTERTRRRTKPFLWQRFH